jgi:hypothetical protein
MDKHDRPYRCDRSECSKLQGFTYSGGLLRHQREVHKMHGGTGKKLFCPEQTCKRSGGEGFTRKENLQEHLRRVHRRTSTGPLPMQVSTDGATIAQKAAEEIERMPTAEREMHEQEPALRQLLEASNSVSQAPAPGAPVSSPMMVVHFYGVNSPPDHPYTVPKADVQPLDFVRDETAELRQAVEFRNAKIVALERENMEQGERLARLEAQMLQLTAQQGSATVV